MPDGALVEERSGIASWCQTAQGKAMAWYRILLQCAGVPPDAGADAAKDITEAFLRRPWHRNVGCDWDGRPLCLVGENDFDPQGLALMDAFSDEISACVTGGFDGDLLVVSITQIASPSEDGFG
nr:hypothetical protein [uncultured Rhodopila sp.]